MKSSREYPFRQLERLSLRMIKNEPTTHVLCKHRPQAICLKGLRYPPPLCSEIPTKATQESRCFLHTAVEGPRSLESVITWTSASRNQGQNVTPQVQGIAISFITVAAAMLRLHRGERHGGAEVSK